MAERERAKGERLARALGWVSIGLGLAALAAPRRVGRLIGVSGEGTSRALLSMVGVRELATGIGILTRHRPSGLLWGRVAGDAMDLALLGGAALQSAKADRGRLALATASVAGLTALDVIGARNVAVDHRLLLPARRSKRTLTDVRAAITVNRPPDEVYRFWRDLENLPRFMRHLEEVRSLGGGRSRWKTRAPMGAHVEWEAILVDDRTNELIAWRSVEGSDIDNSGMVRFSPAPGRRGTEIHVELSYRAPAGRVGSAVAKLFREAPEQQVRDDLRAFKQIMETGEVVQSDATLRRGPHPARPTRRLSRATRGEP